MSNGKTKTVVAEYNENTNKLSITKVSINKIKFDKDSMHEFMYSNKPKTESIKAYGNTVKKGTREWADLFNGM